MPLTFNHKKYNLPSVNMCLYIFISELSRMFQKLPENFSETFLYHYQLVTTEIIKSLHVKKVQFYDCKRVLYFDKSRKVPLCKFPPEKNPPENISDNFVKFRKFFPTRGIFRKIPGKISWNFINKKYNLPAVNAICVC